MATWRLVNRCLTIKLEWVAGSRSTLTGDMIHEDRPTHLTFTTRTLPSSIDPYSTFRREALVPDTNRSGDA